MLMGVDIGQEFEKPKLLTTLVISLVCKTLINCQILSLVISNPKNQWMGPRSFILNVFIQSSLWWLRVIALSDRIIKSLT